jgi:hypothetical protein
MTGDTAYSGVIQILDVNSTALGSAREDGTVKVLPTLATAMHVSRNVHRRPPQKTASGSRIYRLRWAESRFSARSNFPATAGVLKSPVSILRFVASRP